MLMDINYILKVKDARAVEIQKALQAAGIKVTSIIALYKEGGEEAEETKTAEGEKTQA